MENKEFFRRRKRLMSLMGKNSIAIIPSAGEVVRSRDTHYLFRQDSDFWYLSGYNEPDSVLVLLPGRAHGEVVLFNRESDPVLETWHGRRSGQAGAVELLPAADKVPELEAVEEALLLNPRDEALRRAAEDPATAALVVRHWLGSGAAEETQAA